eukprot:13935211-Alexandrium_andersonii.AAC.1
MAPLAPTVWPSVGGVGSGRRPTSRTPSRGDRRRRSGSIAFSVRCARRGSTPSSSMVARMAGAWPGRGPLSAGPPPGWH